MNLSTGIRFVAVFVILSLFVSLAFAGVAVADGGAAHQQAANSVEIAPEITERNGTVDVFVTFDAAAMATESKMDNRSREADTVTLLKQRANSTQAPFREMVANQTGVKMVRRFWITNAVLVEVDTDHVPVEALTAPDGVASLQSSLEISLESTSSDTTYPTTSDSVAAVHGSGAMGYRRDTPDSVSSPLRDSAAFSPSTVAPGHVASGATAPRLDQPTVEPTIESAATGSNVTYGLEMIGAPAVWQTYGATGENVTVAVLDTGVDPAHPDIDLYTSDSDNPTYPGGWAEFDTNGDRIHSEPYDPNGHGTHVSGTVAGGGGGGDPRVGVAPDVRLTHAKILNRNGTATGAQAIAGIEWALETDVDVISISFGTRSDPIWIELVENIRSTDTALAAAIGNGGEGQSSSPGNIYTAVGVGAVASDGDVLGFSGGEVITTDDRWGKHAPADWPATYTVPTVTAPGGDVLSTLPGGGYGTKSGTSMAAPHVAGTTVLALSAAEAPVDIQTIESGLVETADYPVDGPGSPPNSRSGYGIVDAFATAMYVNDDAYLQGHVTNATGAPIDNATVTVGEANVTTDATGAYKVLTDAGNVPVRIQAFGYATKTVTATPQRGSYSTYNATLEEQLTVAVREPFPSTADGGDQIETVLRVASLDSVTLTAGSNSTTNLNRLEPTIDGESVSFGEAVTYDGQSERTVSLGIQTDRFSIGTVDLEITLTGRGENETISSQTQIQPTRSAVSISNQTTDGTGVTVDAAYHGSSSVIGVYADREVDPDNRLGMSAPLAGGAVHESIPIEFDERRTESTLVYVLLLDDGQPVLVDNDAVWDSAFVTVDPIHDSGVPVEVYYAVTDGSEQLTGRHITLARGALIDGQSIRGVSLSGRDLTLLRGYLIETR